MCRLDYDVSEIVEIITNALDLNISESLKYKLIQSDIDRLLSKSVDEVYEEGFDDGFEQAKVELETNEDD